MEWQLDITKTRSISIGIYDSHEKEFIFEIYVKNWAKKIDRSTLSNGTFNISDEKVITPMRSSLLDFFNNVSQLDIESNGFVARHQLDLDINDIKQYQVVWMTYLEKNVLAYLIEEQQKDFLELILLSRFLSSAKYLTHPKFSEGLSLNDILTIQLRNFSYRLYVLGLLMSHEKNKDINFKEHIHQALVNEYERFISFMSETNFNSYFLPNDLKQLTLLINHNSSREYTEVEIDDLINELLKFTLSILEDNGDEINNKISNLTSKLVRNFYLPRYSLKDAMDMLKKGKKISFIDRVNLAAPRLFSSIIIGAVPILLTGEINEWAYDTLNIFQKGINVWGAVLITLILLTSYFICRTYIRIEIENILGYNTKSTVKKRNYIFRLGIRYSFCIALMGHMIFTSHFNFANKVGSSIVIFKKICIFPELLILQFSASFLLGLIIQAVWEDKPLTQPL